MNEIELRVGTQFYYNGIELEVVEREHGFTGCNGCFFYKPPLKHLCFDGACCKRLNCDLKSRKDKKEVYFREVKHEVDTKEIVRDIRNKEALDEFFFKADVPDRIKDVRSFIFKSLSVVYAREMKFWKAAKFPRERIGRFLDNILLSVIVDNANNIESKEERDQEELDFLKEYKALYIMVITKKMKLGSYFDFLNV